MTPQPEITGGWESRTGRRVDMTPDCLADVISMFSGSCPQGLVAEERGLVAVED